jgi:DNA-binding CsgD family transcriptional regulator
MPDFAMMETLNIDGPAARLTDTILGYNEQDLSDTLKQIAAEIGVSHISYIRFAPGKSADTSFMTAIVTFSVEWQSRYFTRQYGETDPVIAYGREAVLPFDWETFGDGDPAVLAFLADATKHGVGPNGVSIPIRNRIGIFSIVSFISDHSRTEWSRYKAAYMGKLQLLSCLIDSAANINFKLPSLPVKLSRREEQCLIWAARGKTYQEIADILELTFGSVKTHLDTARHKLNCMNLTHAAAYAVATGAIPAKALNPLRREEPPAERREPRFDSGQAPERPEPASVASRPRPVPIVSETMRTRASPSATPR